MRFDLRGERYSPDERTTQALEEFRPRHLAVCSAVERQRHFFALDFVSGGAAAALSKSAAAPLERVKLLIQNQNELLKSGRLTQPYRGIGDCFQRVVRDEGVLALWRGNLTNVIRYFPTQAFNFAFKDYIKDLFGLSRERDGHLKWILGNMAAGGAAGVISSALVYSLDFARTRLANDTLQFQTTGTRQYKGLAEVYKKTLASDGVFGLYRGFTASIVGIVLYRSLYFGIYDSVKPFVLVGTFEGNFAASFALGWMVTTCSSLSVYPFDTVRRRMMMTSGESAKYRNAPDAFRVIYRTEGPRAFFRGAGTNILVGMAGAGVLSGYDQLQILTKRLNL